MYFLDAVKVLFRRWYVVLVGLALVSGAAWTALSVVPTQYQASGNVLFLLSPNATGVDTPTNPYLNLDDSLTVTTTLVAGIVTSPEVEQAMAADGFPSDYAVALSPDGTPLLVITATDTDGEAAVATVNEVIGRIDSELARIQQEAGAPADQTILSQTYNVSNEAEALGGSKVRALAVIVAVGLVVTILAAFVVDRLVPLRSRRKQPSPSSRPPDSDDSGPKKRARPVPAAAAEARVGDGQPDARVARVSSDGPRSKAYSSEVPGAPGSSGPP